MVISRIYKIQILIYHNNTQYITKINVWGNMPIVAIIRLGQLNEEHYVPIKQITDAISTNSATSADMVNKKIKYVKAKNRFHKWARELVININESAKIKDTIIQNHLSKLEQDTKECVLEDFYTIDYKILFLFISKFILKIDFYI